jgi:hypothetical protein
VVAAVLAHGLPCILVDDGSSPCAQTCSTIWLPPIRKKSRWCATRKPGQGRGSAEWFCTRRQRWLYTRCRSTQTASTVWRYSKVFEHGKRTSGSVIAGHPVYDESVPKARLYGRYATHVWVWINTLSLDIKDSMCGFRVYPVAPVNALAARRSIGLRMNFDTDILVRLFWDGLQVINLPTRVSYPADGVSHFRVWRDNVLITRMHTVLFFGMLPRIPRLCWRANGKRNERARHALGQHQRISFVAGMRLLFWICRVFGRWPFRVVLYPVLAWYVLTKPLPRRASQDYLRAWPPYANRLPACCATSLRFGESILDKMLLWGGLFEAR